jgi:hypothetical protein
MLQFLTLKGLFTVKITKLDYPFTAFYYENAIVTFVYNDNHSYYIIDAWETRIFFVNKILDLHITLQ